MNKPQLILGIETSCDETAAAVVQKSPYAKASGDKGVKILSNVVASSASLQSKYGGIIPEQAAREQLKSIVPVLKETLRQAQCKSDDLDAIAVTQGPGLIGSLLVGVETAKVLATVWQKPLVPVNHLIGHFYANWIAEEKVPQGEQVPQVSRGESIRTLIPRGTRDTLNTRDTPQFPSIGLLVSGGHTDLVLFKDHGKYEYLGGTRDDAAGEAFDKTARLLRLPYPGGPVISKLAEKGNLKAFKLPRPMIDSDDFDFSFSGLKTAVSNIVKDSLDQKYPTFNFKNSRLLADLSASIQEAIVDVLVAKTLKAAQTFKVDQILVAGGVAANQKLAEKIRQESQKLPSHVRLFIPPPNLCTDNAAYIGTAAFFNYHPTNPLSLQANPNLSLS